MGILTQLVPILVSLQQIWPAINSDCGKWTNLNFDILPGNINLAFFQLESFCRDVARRRVYDALSPTEFGISEKSKEDRNRQPITYYQPPQTWKPNDESVLVHHPKRFVSIVLYGGWSLKAPKPTYTHSVL